MKILGRSLHDYFRHAGKVEPVEETRFVKIHEVIKSAPDAPVSSEYFLGPQGAPVSVGFHGHHVVINLPAKHVVRLVKVDVQELFEGRKVPEGRGFDGPRDKVGLWKAVWRESQGAPRVNVSERGYSFDDIKWELAPYLRVHLVVLGA